MSLTILASEFRGARRIRLFFSQALGSAFLPGFYAVASADGFGASPINVEAVFGIASDPNAAELAVDSDFTAGRIYTVTCTNVPAASGPSFTGTTQNSVGQPVTPPPNVEPETSDYQLLLYGRDIQWAAGFSEDATGDLLTISGRPNFQNAMGRRMTSASLTWDGTYGAKAQQAVDAPDVYQPALAGQFLAQARQDNRTKQASIAFGQNPNDPNGFGFAMEITGRDNLSPISLPIPIPVGTGGQ